MQDKIIGAREVEHDDFSNYRQKYPGRRKRNRTWKYKVESLARLTPQRLAVAQGERRLNWDQFNRECNRLAHGLAALGVKKEDRVAISGFNSIEWLTCYFAISKLGAVPVNVNPRFIPEEIAYVLEDSDAAVCLAEEDYAAAVLAAQAELPGLKKVVIYGIDKRPSEVPAGALVLDDILTSDETNPPVKVYNDDFCFLMYTGGTTGYPKGTVWDGEQRVHGLDITILNGLMPVIDRMFELPEGALRGYLSVVTDSEKTLDILTWFFSRKPVRAALASRASKEMLYGGFRAMLGRPHMIKVLSLMQREGVKTIPASPLFHGAAYELAFCFIGAMGGATIFLPTPHPFSAREFWETVEKHRAQEALIVGDAFAIPLMEELKRAEREGKPFRTKSLWAMISSGVRWSPHVKKEMMEHIPHMVVQDVMGASETSAGFAEMNISTDDKIKLAGAKLASSAGGIYKHELFPSRVVNPETGKDVQPGSGEIGEFLYGGWMALGYWKCPAKTANDFRVLDGKRWFFVGDAGTLDADGKFNLIGRTGSYMINTGGEKVYSEEVEGILKEHPSVLDCAVIGMPDPRFGQAVAALVELESSATVTPDELVDYCRSRMADYKRPRQIFCVEKVPRAAAGKIDRAMAMELVAEQVQAD